MAGWLWEVEVICLFSSQVLRSRRMILKELHVYLRDYTQGVSLHFDLMLKHPGFGADNVNESFGGIVGGV